MSVLCHGLDTPERVCFYEQDFYVLSNFSAFNLQYGGHIYPTAEHAYQTEKFFDNVIRFEIANAPSAHDAFKTAERKKPWRRHDWEDVKVGIMREILLAKVHQHPYVRRKLLETRNRELVENSWRDSFWGWGPRQNGLNMLGKLWMGIRTTLRQCGTCGSANTQEFISGLAPPGMKLECLDCKSWWPV